MFQTTLPVQAAEPGTFYTATVKAPPGVSKVQPVVPGVPGDKRPLGHQELHGAASQPHHHAAGHPRRLRLRHSHPAQVAARCNLWAAVRIIEDLDDAELLDLEDAQ